MYGAHVDFGRSVEDAIEETRRQLIATGDELARAEQQVDVLRRRRRDLNDDLTALKMELQWMRNQGPAS